MKCDKDFFVWGFFCCCCCCSKSKSSIPHFFLSPGNLKRPNKHHLSHGNSSTSFKMQQRLRKRKVRSVNLMYEDIHTHTYFQIYIYTTPVLSPDKESIANVLSVSLQTIALWGKQQICSAEPSRCTPARPRQASETPRTFTCPSTTAGYRACASFQIPRKSKQRQAATTELSLKIQQFDF